MSKGSRSRVADHAAYQANFDDIFRKNRANTAEQQRLIKFLVDNNISVLIDENYDAGLRQLAIVADRLINPNLPEWVKGNWVDSFATSAEAVEYCKQHNLRITAFSFNAETTYKRTPVDHARGV